jgi:transposase
MPRRARVWKRLSLREMTADERAELTRLTRSRKTEARVVERARILLALADGERPSAIARRLGVTRITVYGRLRRFNRAGLRALHDDPRTGRPPRYTPAERAEVIAAALTRPDDLGLPFGCWTLDRLAAYLAEEKNIPMKRSRIDEVLRAEGLRWRTQETWLGSRVDPAFAEKKRPSRRRTPPRPKGA